MSCVPLLIHSAVISDRQFKAKEIKSVRAEWKIRFQMFNTEISTAQEQSGDIGW